MGRNTVLDELIDYMTNNRMRYLGLSKEQAFDLHERRWVKSEVIPLKPGNNPV